MSRKQKGKSNPHDLNPSRIATLVVKLGLHCPKFYVNWTFQTNQYWLWIWITLNESSYESSHLQLPEWAIRFEFWKLIYSVVYEKLLSWTQYFGCQIIRLTFFLDPSVPPSEICFEPIFGFEIDFWPVYWGIFFLWTIFSNNPYFIFIFQKKPNQHLFSQSDLVLARHVMTSFQSQSTTITGSKVNHCERLNIGVLLSIGLDSLLVTVVTLVRRLVGSKALEQ